MIWAHKHRVDVDTFVVYTDHETWAGDVPPAQALRGVSRRTGNSGQADRGRNDVDGLQHR
jgi:hypothetical protein